MDSSKTSPKIPIEPAIRALAEHQRRELGSHLEVDELVAYHAQELADADAERVRDHLALCPECAGLLLDLDAFSEPSPAGAPDLTTAEVESAWRELAPRLTEDPPPVVRFPPRAKAPSVPWRALAAALFFGAIGLSFWNLTLRREVKDLSQPRVDTEIADLQPAAEERVRSAGEPAVKTVEAGHPILLILQPHLESSFPRYELAILGANGRVHWRGEGRGTDQNTFRLQVPAGRLPPGPYHVILYGIEDSQHRRLQEFGFAITAH